MHEDRQRLVDLEGRGLWAVGVSTMQDVMELDAVGASLRERSGETEWGLTGSCSVAES